MSRTERVLRTRLENMVRENRRLADGLQNEAESPVGCIRQSPESKLARADVLRVCADEVERILSAKK